MLSNAKCFCWLWWPYGSQPDKKHPQVRWVQNWVLQRCPGACCFILYVLTKKYFCQKFGKTEPRSGHLWREPFQRIDPISGKEIGQLKQMLPLKANKFNSTVKIHPSESVECQQKANCLFSDKEVFPWMMTLPLVLIQISSWCLRRIWFNHCALSSNLVFSPLENVENKIFLVLSPTYSRLVA